MSSSIAAECFHGTISCDEAEARLRANGKDRSYLTRRCEIKAGSYVLSYIVGNNPKHSLIPSISTKKKAGGVKYEDLYVVVEQFISSSQFCENAVLLAPASPSADRDDQPCAAGGEHGDCHQGSSDGATTAAVYAEVYFNLLCSMEPSILKLTGSQELDDRIYSEFKQSFPILGLDLHKFVEDDIKNEVSSEEWRKFSERFKDVDDYSQECLLRLDSSKEYTEENTVIVTKLQFLAIEIARNREGCNDSLRTNFKPTKRSARVPARESPDPCCAGGVGSGGGLPHHHHHHHHGEEPPQSQSLVSIPIKSSGSTNKCYVCNFQHEDYQKVVIHLQTHRVRWCHDCTEFKPVNGFYTHKCTTKTDPLLECDKCDYKTKREWNLERHMKSHTHSCTICKKSFSTMEFLERHERLHNRTIKCEDCDAPFYSMSNKMRHMRLQHSPAISCDIGFFIPDVLSLPRRRRRKENGGGRTVLHCDKENCSYKTCNRSNLNRHKSTHLAKKKKPLPEIHQCSSKCRYSVVNRHRLLRHQKSCRYHRASQPRIVPLVSNRRVCEVSNNADVSQRKIVQIVRGVLGDDMLEPGLEAALKENLNQMDDYYTVKDLKYTNSKGRSRDTALAIVKDVNETIQLVCEARGIKNPLIAVGCDGGQGKLVVTLSVFDKDDETERDPKDPSPGGKRRVILLAAADGAPEKRPVLNEIYQQLRTWTIKHEVQYIGDCKITNLLFGKLEMIKTFITFL